MKFTFFGHFLNIEYVLSKVADNWRKYRGDFRYMNVLPIVALMAAHKMIYAVG